tara:strand:- start:4816 stop:7194 length:2379 start_codon:yes stop_codon:yes gene_type:complete
VKVVKTILATVLFQVGFFSAQTPAPMKIAGVEVEGNNITTATVVKYTSGIVEGKEIMPGEFGKAVKKLWATGFFSDIQVQLDRESVDGLYVTIIVEETPILGNVTFTGDKKKRRDIEDELDLKKGQRIRPHLIKESIEKIKRLLAEDGYLRAHAEATITDGDMDNVKDVSFRVKTGKKVKIGAINFHGNEAFKERKLRKEMKDTKIQKWYLFWRTAFDKEKFRTDKGLLTQFYQNNGFKDFRIVADSLSYSKNGKINLDLWIHEGEKYYFRNFTWEGNDLYEMDELVYTLDIRKGDLFNGEEFDKAVNERVHGLYMDRGYIYSMVNPMFTPIGDDSIDVHFSITENHQVSVRRLDISGNDRTRENVIRREMKVIPGEVFNRELLMRSAREVFILNYFADVRPDVIPVDEDEIDILLTVEEKSSDQANANIGYSQEFGIMGGGGVQFNNFSGKGQQFAVNLSQGVQGNMRNYGYGFGYQAAQYKSISFSFTDPMVNDRPVLLGFSVFYYLRGQNRYYYSIPFDREMQGASFRIGTRLKWPDNYFRSFWAISISQKNYRGTEENLKEYGLLGISNSVGLSFSQTVTRDSRNHPEFPSRGSSFSWTSTLSGGPFSSELLPVHENFHKHILKFDWFTNPFWKAALVSSWQFGAIKDLPPRHTENTIIPIDEKFIMGGSGIPYGTLLRGYQDNTVGPYNRYPLGGRVMMKYLAEIRFPFSENPTVYGLLFAEMGNNWLNFKETDPFDLKRSAGFGIRMFMPMLGMLGFDMGYGFDDISFTEKSPEGWRFHVLFGMPL